MAKTKVKVKLVAQNDGIRFPPNGSVDMNIKVDGSQWFEYIMKLGMMFNQNVKIHAKVDTIDGGKPFELGMFDLNAINTNGDREAKVKFSSTVGYVNLKELSTIVEATAVDKSVLIVLLCTCEIDVEESEEDDDE